MATFDMDVVEAQRLIEELQRRAADQGGVCTHPYESLFAVARKVKAQVGDGGPCDTERGKHEIGED